MRVAVDGSFASFECGGVGAYVVEVIRGLASRGVELYVITPGNRPDISGYRGVSIMSNSFPFFSAPDRYVAREEWEQTVVRTFLEDVRPDVFFGPVFNAPINWSGPKVVTVHDLAFELPGLNPDANQQYYARWARASSQSASHVIAVSESTRQDVRRVWGRTHCISTTHLAPSLSFVSHDRDAAARCVERHYGLTDPYILHVGGGAPRKNLPRLIGAFRRVHDSFPDYHLLIVGSPADELLQCIRSHKLGSRVSFTGFCDRAILPHVYAAADCFVYPSLMEGFGLPPLEAMASGVPTVVADRPIFHETCGDAALYVDPQNESEISAGICAIASSHELRSQLVRTGRVQAAKYSWRLTAERTAKVLADVLGSPTHLLADVPKRAQ